MTIEQTLSERHARYGRFSEHAVVAQAIQDAMRAHHGWDRLAPDQKQALTTIADKIARILNGDPDYVDNWHDIIGYARLVEDRLTGTGLHAQKLGGTAAQMADIARFINGNHTTSTTHTHTRDNK